MDRLRPGISLLSTLVLARHRTRIWTILSHPGIQGVDNGQLIHQALGLIDIASTVGQDRQLLERGRMITVEPKHLLEGFPSRFLSTCCKQTPAKHEMTRYISGSITKASVAYIGGFVESPFIEVGVGQARKNR